MCKKFVEKYVTLVSVESPTNTVGHTVRDIRDSLIEKLGIIGGTIGLFTGFSLLSLLEIIFIGIYVYNQCFKKNVVDVDDNDCDKTKDSTHDEWKNEMKMLQERLTILENVCTVVLEILYKVIIRKLFFQAVTYK